MVFPYIGALKTILYWPILKIFEPSAYALRLPVILIGAVTIYLFNKTLSALAAPSLALIGSLILASDPSFLLMNTFDWGPVALEHLLLVAAACCYLHRRWFSASFILGLALWNKAVFVWALAGIVAGGSLVWAIWGPRLTSRIRLTLATALAVFALGAAPLALFSMGSPNAILSMAKTPPLGEAFERNLTQLENTLDGSDLFGAVVREDYAAQPREVGPFETAVRGGLGEHRKSIFALAFLVALAAAPFIRRAPYRPPLFFAATFFVVSFVSMLLSGGGTAGHHIVLLWPAPHFIVAAALMQVNVVWLRNTLIGALVVSNLLVVNEYVYKLERNGAATAFTDAIAPLSDLLASNSAKTVYLADWGMWDNLIFLSEGDLHLVSITDSIQQGAKEELKRFFDDDQGVFVAHVEGHEIFEGINSTLANAASGLGYQPTQIGVVRDSNGRPTFGLWRYTAMSGK